MKYLEYTVQNEIGLLTLNRPKSLNALNAGLIEELETQLSAISTSSVRCLIITGAGDRAFAAGADISELANLDVQGATAASERGSAVMEMVENLPMPVIAAVNGFALGGGCELALSCDIRICADTALFGLPEVGIGVLPGYGGVQRMARTVGLAKAKELVFTARNVKAAEALEIGLANRVVPAAELQQKAMEMAEKIAANAPCGVRAAKQVANQSVGCTLAQATRLDCAFFGACFNTQDQTEGMAAFLEKRKHAPYTGK